MAAVEIAKRDHAGPFRAIAPLFQIALEPQRGKRFEVETAARMLQPILGDAFTIHTLEAFAPQLVKEGWLIEEASSKEGMIYRVADAFSDNIDEASEQSSINKLERLFTAFQDFLSQTSPLLNFTMDKETFVWQMFQWATSLDGTNKASIISAATAMMDGKKYSIGDNYFDEVEKYSKIQKQLNVEFAAFVRWMSRSGRNELLDLAALTELGLALDFIEEIRNPSDKNLDKIDCIFVLDAPVLLDLFGLSGKSRKESLTICVKALKMQGARFMTLNHCLEELSEILKSVLRLPRHQRFGLTGDALKKQPELEQTARSIEARPDQAAKQFGIEIVHFDKNSPLDKDFFSTSLVDSFKNAATWHDPLKYIQRERDALSIAYVMRRRKGSVNSDLLYNKCSLITRNSKFTRFAELFCKRNFRLPEYSLGPAIEIKTLAANTWMRFGSSSDPDLPKIHLISACDRILQSNAAIMKKAEQKVVSLKNMETAELLLNQDQAVFDLISAIGGDADVIDATNAEEIVRILTKEAERRGIKKERERGEREKTGIITELEITKNELTSVKDRLSDLSLQNLRAEAAIRERDAELERINTNRQERYRQVYQSYCSFCKFIAKFTFSVIFLFLLLFSIFGQFFVWSADWFFNTLQSTLYGSSIIFSSICVAAFTFRFFRAGKVDFHNILLDLLVTSCVEFRISRVTDLTEREGIRRVTASHAPTEE